MSKSFVMIYVDCTERGANSDLLQQYEIRFFPTMVLTDSDGEPLDQFVGAKSAKVVLAKFEEHSDS